MTDHVAEVARSPWPPLVDGEDSVSYALRLEGAGYDEIFIRKALRTRFGLSLKDLSDFFPDDGIARMRHVKLIMGTSNRRTDYSLMRKIAKDLGVSNERAMAIIERVRIAGDRRDLESREFP